MHEGWKKMKMSELSLASLSSEARELIMKISSDYIKLGRGPFDVSEL